MHRKQKFLQKKICNKEEQIHHAHFFETNFSYREMTKGGWAKWLRTPFCQKKNVLNSYCKCFYDITQKFHDITIWDEKIQSYDSGGHTLTKNSIESVTHTHTHTATILWPEDVRERPCDLKMQIAARSRSHTGKEILCTTPRGPGVCKIRHGEQTCEAKGPNGHFVEEFPIEQEEYEV